MKTREEFVKKWLPYLSGIALCGHCHDAKEGPMAKGARVVTIPDEMRELLGRMYDDMTATRKP